MHADLSPHLHSEECNQAINALKKCHKDNSFKKFLGVCNELDALMVKCLRKERIARQCANNEKAVEKRNSLRNKSMN